MAATFCRKSLSLPVRSVNLETDSCNDHNLLQADVEARLSTSPNLPEARSPQTAATFSPVFDLELGGSCNSTPSDRRAHGCHARGGLRHGTTASPLPRQLPTAAMPTVAALRNLPNSQLLHNVSVIRPAGTITGGGGGLDRSVSDLQVLWSRHNGGDAPFAPNLDLLPPAWERLSELCKPSNDLELELSKHLRAFRAARIAKESPAVTSSSTAPGVQSGTALLALDEQSPHTPLQQLSAGSSLASAVAGADGGGSAGAGGNSPSGPIPGEIEALASELQSEGLLVQILDGTRLSKDARFCLRTLKHRFLVCLGRAPPQRRSLADAERRLGAESADAASCSGSSSAACVGAQVPSQLLAREVRLNEPLVVEVRFREQFLIANPTQAYQMLLLALPVVFAGPQGRLDAVVDLMAAEVAEVFRAAKRPLPPWRTKGAMLSKWAPAQLRELGRLMRCATQQHQMDGGQFEGSDTKHCTEMPQHPTTAIATLSGPAASSPRNSPFGLLAPPPGIGTAELWTWSDRRTADGTTAAEAAVVTLDDVGDDALELVPRSNSAPPRAVAAPRAAEQAAGHDTAVLSAAGASVVDFIVTPDVEPGQVFGAAPSTGQRYDKEQQGQQPGGHEDEQWTTQVEGRERTPLAVGVEAPGELLFRPLRGLSSFSPFACISVPEQHECKYDDVDCGSVRPVPWIAQQTAVQGGGDGGSISSDGHAVEEFTFKDTVLDSHDPGHCTDVWDSDVHMMLSRRDVPAYGSIVQCGPGQPWPRDAPLPTAADASQQPADAPKETDFGPLMAVPSAGAAPGTAVKGVFRLQQPMATGPLGPFGGGADPAVPRAAAGGAAESCLVPVASHQSPSVAGNDDSAYTLSLSRPDTLLITRRSSSDLHRAAEKFKKATSLLATAIRLAKGSGNCSNSTREGASVASGSSAQRQWHQKDDAALRAAAVPCGGSTAAAAATMVGIAVDLDGRPVARRTGAGAGVCTQQVPLAGGVMTKPVGDEPTWARGIRTVKWNQKPPVAVATTGAVPGTVGGVVRGAPA